MRKYVQKIKLLLKGNYIPQKIHKREKQWVGNQYGGFYINFEGLNKSSIIYSFGIGEDISFDLGVMEKLDCKVFAFDPTPKSVEWVLKNNTNSDFIFHPIGLAKQKGPRKFYFPKNKDHVSGSIHNITTTNREDSVILNFDTLKNIMQKNNHDKIDVLKIDIEGAEYEVIEKITKDRLDINQILVEFHPHFEKEGKKKTIQAIKSLEQMGYKCFGRSDSSLEYSFIK